MPWALVLILAATLSCMLINLSNHFYERYAFEVLSHPDAVNGYTSVPIPAVDGYAGAPWYLFWIDGLAYLTLCLIPYWLLLRRRESHASRRPAA
jgi:hypothetical protein